jgi:cardiolipin synthase
MPETLYNPLHVFFANGLLLQLTSVLGFIMGLILVARLMREKRAPANTFAWMLGILLVPWIGVPLFLLIGDRKLRRVIKRKSRLLPKLPSGAISPADVADTPIAQTIVSSGAPPPIAGNSIRFFSDGEDAYATLEKQIRAAEHSIHITTFILGRDDTGRRLIQLLAERARAGVKVRLLLDAVGSFVASGGFTRPLREAGGEVGKFMRVIQFSTRGSANLRSHRKIAVFDHQVAAIGGYNLAREYMGPRPYKKRWQDFGAVIEGPAVVLLNEVFIADWCFTTGQAEAKLLAETPPAAAASRNGSVLQIVASGPDVPGDPLYEGIVSMLQEAKQSIWIVTPYFIPDDVLFRSLVVKARSGVEVNVIVPARSDHPVTDFARRHYLRELTRAGARVLLFGPGMLHSKAMIVDDRVGLFGSTNFDLRSLLVNFEIGVVVHTAADAKAMRAWAAALAKNCREFKINPAKKPSLLGNLAEDLSRLLAPLL